ncbi:hypothetical protein Pmani_023124 [Petrolisthes manimaculis]|uniref:Uncharacterized protein n=1 Tax=Petrolisthes manimaculis TaxID=1843537 RepID=A0AAE1PCK4_9EUCA|nr:hypothetical protein Pmani_023124 [Petrolisthes manimaculis]
MQPGQEEAWATMMLNNLVPMPGKEGRPAANEGLQMDQRTIKSVNGTLDNLAFNQTTSTTTKVQTTDSQGTPARPILSHNTQNLHGVVRVEGWTKHLPKKPVASGSIGTLHPLQISVKNVRPVPQTRSVQVRLRPAQPIRPQSNPQSIRNPPRHVRHRRCSTKCCHCVPCRPCSRKSTPRARNPAPRARNPAPRARNPAPVPIDRYPAPVPIDRYPAPVPIDRYPAPAPAPIARNLKITI